MKYVAPFSPCLNTVDGDRYDHAWKLLHWWYKSKPSTLDVEAIFFCERCLARHKQTEDYE